jgi:hypothetical protein
LELHHLVVFNRTLQSSGICGLASVIRRQRLLESQAAQKYETEGESKEIEREIVSGLHHGLIAQFSRLKENIGNCRIK